MKLHRGVKEVYASGDGSSAGLSGLSELREARESVQRAVERLGLDARVGGQSSTARAERNPSDNQVDQTKDSADADDEDISAWA